MSLDKQIYSNEMHMVYLECNNCKNTVKNELHC
jgi:hypothetical protein